MEEKLKNIKSDETEEMRSLVAMLSISKLFLSIFVNGPFQTLSGADIMFLWKGKNECASLLAAHTFLIRHHFFSLFNSWPLFTPFFPVESSTVRGRR